MPLKNMMKNLRQDIEKNIDISHADLEKVLSQFHTKSYIKKDSITSYGRISNHLQFIESGLIRIFIIDNRGKDITVQIGIENMWVNNLYSFFTQTPSENHIEILEPTTILQIHRVDLEKLYNEVPAMESFSRLKLQQSYCRLHKRTYRHLTNSAEESYLEFRNTYGHIIENRVPQYVIASYLNLSPEHLSKVRRNLAKK